MSTCEANKMKLSTVDTTLAEKADELRLAARSGDIDEITKLLSNSSDDEVSQLLTGTDDLSGNTALHLCCANGHEDIVKLLISRGALINALNKSGSTPLHYAALTGQLDVVSTLLKSGASAVVENSFERTAMDEALNGRHQRVVEYLRDYVERQAENRKESVIPTEEQK